MNIISVNIIKSIRELSCRQTGYYNLFFLLHLYFKSVYAGDDLDNIGIYKTINLNFKKDINYNGYNFFNNVQ